MKKCQTWVWVVAYLLAMAGWLCNAKAATTATDGDWEFSYDDTYLTATIQGYSGTSPALVFPTKVSRVGTYQTQDSDGEWHTHYRTYTYTVQGIGHDVCKKYTWLTSISIPDTVTSLGIQTFSGCTGLTEVTIPDSVTRVPYGTFEYCSELQTVKIGNGVTSMGNYTFYECRKLSEVTLGNGLQNLWDGVFWNCSQLTSITIPSSLKHFGTATFQGCRLENVWFKCAPPSLTVNGLWGVQNPFSGGIVEGARGYYTAEHAEAWKAVIGADGKWCGLIMEEMKVPKPELQVDHANPAEGSLTLAWADEGGGEGVTYSVYRGAGESRSEADCVTNGLTGNSWEDKEYWKAEPVMKPLNYWVVAKGSDGGERESNRVETRHRYGVCVGYDAYGKWTKAKAHPQSLADANLCKELAQKAGFSMTLLKNSGAKAQDISDAIAKLAEETAAGDTVLFYISTHGGIADAHTGSTQGLGTCEPIAVLTAYDKPYYVTDFVTDVATFKSGVGFVGVIMACLSKAMVDGAELTGEGLNWFLENGLAECPANVAWVTSCGADENSVHLDDWNLTVFGEWFLHQGWQNKYADGNLTGVGYAGGNGDGTNTLLEVAQYAKAFARGASDKNPAHVFFQSEALLAKTIVSLGKNSGGTGLLRVPETLSASQGIFDSRIEVSWPSMSGALCYWVYGLKDGRTGALEDDWDCLSYIVIKAPVRDDVNTGVGREYSYRVRAVYPTGASGFSPIATGWRGSGRFVDWIQRQAAILKLVGTIEELAAMPSANGASLEACYVAGLDPTDEKDTFSADLKRNEQEKWQVGPKGGKKAGRVYTVEGKKEMTDEEEWTDVTDVEDLAAEGWRFFRLGVELDE